VASKRWEKRVLSICLRHIDKTAALSQIAGINSVGWLTGCDVMDRNVGWTAAVREQLKTGG
jgi:hypothetical protein